MTRRVILVVPVAAFGLLDDSGARAWGPQESEGAPALQIFVARTDGRNDADQGSRPMLRSSPSERPRRS